MVIDLAKKLFPWMEAQTSSSCSQKFVIVPYFAQSTSTPRSSSCSPPVRFPTKILYEFLVFPMRPTPLFNNNNIWWNEAVKLCNFLQSFITSSGDRIAQWYSARLRAGWSGVWFSVGAGNLSPHPCVQTVSGAHPASYPMGTRGSFPRVKAAGALSWPLTSI
jgi:hypothetical protein